MPSDILAERRELSSASVRIETRNSPIPHFFEKLFVRTVFNYYEKKIPHYVDQLIFSSRWVSKYRYGASIKQRFWTKVCVSSKIRCATWKRLTVMQFNKRTQTYKWYKACKNEWCSKSVISEYDIFCDCLVDILCLCSPRVDKAEFSYKMVRGSALYIYDLLYELWFTFKDCVITGDETLVYKFENRTQADQKSHCVDYFFRYWSFGPSWINFGDTGGKWEVLFGSIKVFV